MEERIKRTITDSEIIFAGNPIPANLSPNRTVCFDFGEKAAGEIRMKIIQPRSVRFRYCFASHEALLQMVRQYGESPSMCIRSGPTFIRSNPSGVISFSETCETKEIVIDPGTVSVLRYLEISNISDDNLLISEVYVRSTMAASNLTGFFTCTDESVNRAWDLGVHTVRMCMQPQWATFRPLDGPWSTHVLWEGLRRDKDIWAGDLRAASLTALYSLDRVDVIKNSIHAILQGQHLNCCEDGMVPGSASWRATYYEWTMWWVVNLWEFVLITGDIAYLKYCEPLIRRLHAWLDRKPDERGLIKGGNSWMYTIKVNGCLSSIIAAQKAAYDALANMYALLGDEKGLGVCRGKSQKCIRSMVREFSVEGNPLFKMQTGDGFKREHFAADSNLFAILCGMIDKKRAEAMLEFMKDKFWTPRGTINIWPVFDDSDGEWWTWWEKRDDDFKHEAVWRHNNCIWPFICSYEVLARFYTGDITTGLELLKRYSKAHIQQNQSTLWEMMNMDGSIPAGLKCDVLSLCHCMGSVGSYALQAYIAGIRPVKPGFEEFTAEPALGPLDWVKSEIPTPSGIIEVELEQDRNGNIAGIVKHPGNLKPVVKGGRIQTRRL